MEDDAIDAASVPSEGKHAPPKGKVQGGSFARVPIAALVDRSLNDGDVRTLGGICAYMRKDDYAWPSQLLLGMATGRSRCAANRSVKKLASRGHITVNLYTLWGVGGGFAFRFLDPLLKTGLPWAINLSVSEQWWIYDQPDVVVDPNTMRYQNDTILSLVLTVPFDDRTTFSLTGGRFVRASTVPNYAFENNSFMFGVSWRF
jgi:hypothetical protein